MVRCTYSDCPEVFASVREMKAHKIRDPEHDYCRRCDLDFEDEERLLLHKLKMNTIEQRNDHIACPICGVDFKSDGGRAFHIRQNHRADQDLVCCGCQEHFKTASALVRHIEFDECLRIDGNRLVQEQAKKILIKQALKAGEGDPMPIIPKDVDDNDDIEGGVKLNMQDLENQEAMQNQTKWHAHGSSTLDTTIDKHWPKPGSKAKGTTARKSISGDLMGFAELSLNSGDNDKESPSSAKEKGKARFSSSTSQGSAGDEGEKKSEAQAKPKLCKSNSQFGLHGILDAGRMLRMLNGSWDATAFFNSFRGTYDCTCGKSFLSMNEFQEHVLGKTGAKKDTECPACYRQFKTIAALIAHFESPSTRCTVAGLDGYGQIMDEISGGFIQVNGILEDGTPKYEAGRVDPEPTATGADDETREW
ncbi:hypothetical protein MAP00_000810 [Monascus purpureus]|nr:hypothetical protein MAP00_000810 [Monascus purpureus]